MSENRIKQSHQGPSSILGSILKNEPRMIRPNPGGIVSRNPLPLLAPNMAKTKGDLGSESGSTHYANNVNVTKGKRGISALGKTNVVLDQSMNSEHHNVTRYSVAKKGGNNQTSQPDLQEVKKEDETPANNSFYGIFTSLIGGSKKSLKPNAT